VVLSGLAVVAGGCAKETRPDVLIVTIDTLRADHTSAYGYNIPTTPELERIASLGLLFERAYAPTSTTAPSHAALLSGRHPRSLGVLKNGHVISESETMLAEIFGDAGYATSAFVSSFPVRAEFGFEQGFNTYYENFTVEESSLGSENYTRGRNRIAEFTTRRYLQWLGAASDRRARFSWVHYVDPHAPYKAPVRFKGEWAKGVRGFVRQYDEEIHYVDSWLGKLFDGAREEAGERGLVFLVTSDHGEGLGDHKWMGHGVNLYEEAVRVPMVLVAPGVAGAGERVAEPVSLVDVAATVVELAGVETDAPFEGQGLLGDHRVLDRPIVLQRRSYASKRDGKKEVRGSLVGLVRWPEKLLTAPHEDVFELYNLDFDPIESVNLVNGKRTRSKSLKREVADWEAAHPEPSEMQGELSEDDKAELRAIGYVD
jgi:choline-sulfatase